MKRTGGFVSIAFLIMALGLVSVANAAPAKKPAKKPAPAEAQAAYPAIPKPAPLPEWAEQGMFRYIRIDGGRIEVMKAERTHWGRGFNAKEKETLGHVYNKYADKMLGLLKDAHFNWIWVTWSNGWSIKEESDSRKELTELIKRCHAEGIKVTAYMSATNMFWENMFLDEPQSVPWTLIEGGRPVMYTGGLNPMRFVADLRNEGWRAYTVKRAVSAVEAGADAVFYDNVIGDTRGMALLLSETRAAMDKKSAELGLPRVLLTSNVHLDPDRLILDEYADYLWQEDGKSTPGIWTSGWELSNARKLKYLYGIKRPGQSVQYEDDVYRCGARETCIPAPEEQKLTMAETRAFGAETSRNIEGRFLKGLLLDEQKAKDAWAVIALYNKFAEDNSDLYHRASQVEPFLLASVDSGYNLAEAFIRRNVMFGFQATSRIGRGTPLSSYKAVLFSPFTGKLTNEGQVELKKFVAAGGKVFAPKGAALNVKYEEISGDTFAKMEKSEATDELVARLEKATGGPVVKIENGGNVVANVTKKDGADKYIIHLMNYSYKEPAEKLRVRFNTGGYAGKMKGCDVRLLSPDGDQPAVTAAPDGAGCSFDVASVQRYTLAVVTPKR